MELLIAVTTILGVLFAIGSNTTFIVRFLQEQRDKRAAAQAKLAETAVAAGMPAQRSADRQDPGTPDAADGPVAAGTGGGAPQPAPPAAAPSRIHTPDQRLRVFVSADLEELAEERRAAKEAVGGLHLAPVLFELGARPHAPRELYRAYLAQSHVFLGIYWQRYGAVGPGLEISELEDEYLLSDTLPKLIYVKTPAPGREPRLGELLEHVRADDRASYKQFETAEELRELIENDVALLLSERFEMAAADAAAPARGRPGGLPAPLNAFVGRERELAELSELLASAGTRLITLHGPGGVGKSRLALELARKEQARFEGGVYFVDLSPLQDAELVAATIAAALGLRESQGSWRESLLTFLKDRHGLLLLDNFERVSAAAPLVAKLLAACPFLQVLVTSRSLLHISWEHACAVEPFAPPEPAPATALEPLARNEAVRLFVARARAVRPDFELKANNSEAVAAITRRLDGLPLAIELAAARLRLFSPQALSTRLSQTGSQAMLLRMAGARDLPARQQTLRDTLTWSYELLDPDRQALFRRLAVFVGGFTLEAAEAVISAAAVSTESKDGPAGAATPGATSVMDGLAALLDESLLQPAQQGDEGPRLRMLGIVREYALELLQQDADATRLAAAHAAFFLGLAENAARPEAVSGQRLLGTEHDNLRAALDWYRRTGDTEASLQLASALSWFWIKAGYLSEGRAQLEEALSRAGAQPDSPMRARAHFGAGLVAWHQGDFAAARAHLEASVDLWHVLDAPPLLPRTLNWLARLLAEQGEHDRAGVVYTEALALCRAGQDRSGEAGALHGLGSLALHQGDHAAARILYDHSLEIGRQIGNTGLTGRTLQRLGELDWLQGHRASALSRYREVDRLIHLEENRHELLPNLHILGWDAYRLGEHAWAEALLEEGLVQAQRQGDARQLAWAHNHLGDVARCRGDDDRAAELYGQALELFSELRHQQGIAAVRHNQGYLALHRGDEPAARALFHESLALFRSVGHRWSVADSLAALAATEERPEDAARLFAAAQASHDAIDMSSLQRNPANWAESRRYQQSSRARADEAAWEAAWSEGRGWSLEQAVAYALRPPEEAGSAPA